MTTIVLAILILIGLHILPAALVLSADKLEFPDEMPKTLLVLIGYLIDVIVISFFALSYLLAQELLK